MRAKCNPGFTRSMRKATSKRFTIRPKLAESPSIACPHRHAALRGCDSMKTNGLENRSLVAYKTDRINPGLRVDSRSESALTRGYCLSSRCDCGIVRGTKVASIDSLRTAICRTAQLVPSIFAQRALTLQPRAQRSVALGFIV